ncbi:MAG: hypothetical protein IIW01_07240, partial [Thermoguttaceae bacterium]|nr:hypothetical protein [Thermoguttaceae bacterium]
SDMILSAMAQAYLSSFAVNFAIISCIKTHLQIQVCRTVCFQFIMKSEVLQEQAQSKPLCLLTVL